MLPPRGEDKVIVVLQAYFDESGINPNDKFCVIAGYVGTARKWSEFEDGWKRATGGVDFHSKRFFARTPTGARLDAYAGWDDDKASAYLGRILETVRFHLETNLTAVCAAVDVAAFGRLSEQEKQWLTGGVFQKTKQGAAKLKVGGKPSAPYFVAFVSCVTAAVHSCRRKSKDQVHLTFDQQNVMMGYASESYQRLGKYSQTKDLREGISGLSFISSKGVGALQAADLQAYAVFQYGKLDRKVSPEIQRVVDVFASQDGQYVRVWNEQFLKRAVAGFADQMRRTRPR